MSFQSIIKRALEIRAKYAEFEKKEYGSEWTKEQLVQGFVGDVEDLVSLTVKKDNSEGNSDTNQKIRHELADCLWSVIVIAEKYGVDLEEAFYDTMDELDNRLTSK